MIRAVARSLRNVALVVLSAVGPLAGLGPLCGAEPPPRIPRSAIPADLPANLRPLIEDLYHADLTKQLAAVKALAALGAAAAPAAPFLASMLDTSNKHAKGAAEAVKALIALGPVAVPPTLTALQLGGRYTKGRALDILAKLQDPRAVPTLIALAADPGGEYGRLLECLNGLGDRARQPLLAQLRDSDPAIRRQAVLAAVAFPDAAMAGELATALADSDAGVRQAALAAIDSLLTGNGKLAALPVASLPATVAANLGRNLRDPDLQLRIQALRLARQVPGSADAALLLSLVGHDDRELRLLALDLIAGLSETDAAPVLAAAMNRTGEPAEQAAALTALARRGGAAADARLVEAIKSPHAVVRQSVVAAVAAHRPDLVDAVAGPLTTDPEPGVRVAAITALAGRPAFRAAVLKGLDDRDGGVRQQIVALAAERDLVEVLLIAIEPERPVEIRLLAAELLGGGKKVLADPAVGTALNRAAGDGDRRVRRAALFALGQVGQGFDGAAARAALADPGLRELALRALTRAAPDAANVTAVEPFLGVAQSALSVLQRCGPPGIEAMLANIDRFDAQTRARLLNDFSRSRDPAIRQRVAAIPMVQPGSVLPSTPPPAPPQRPVARSTASSEMPGLVSEDTEAGELLVRLRSASPDEAADLVEALAERRFGLIQAERSPGVALDPRAQIAWSGSDALNREVTALAPDTRQAIAARLDRLAQARLTAAGDDASALSAVVLRHPGSAAASAGAERLGTAAFLRGEPLLALRWWGFVAVAAEKDAAALRGRLVLAAALGGDRREADRLAGADPDLARLAATRPLAVAAPPAWAVPPAWAAPADRKAPAVTPAWSATISAASGSGVAIGSGSAPTVVVRTSDAITGFRLSDGRQSWTTPLALWRGDDAADQAIAGDPGRMAGDQSRMAGDPSRLAGDQGRHGLSVGGGRVFALAGFRHVDPRTWRKHQGSAGGDGSDLVALDATSGAVQWRIGGASAAGDDLFKTACVLAPPAVDGDAAQVLLVQGGSYHLAAVAVSDGALRWSVELGPVPGLDGELGTWQAARTADWLTRRGSMPALTDDLVVVCTNAGLVAAVERSGQPRWATRYASTTAGDPGSRPPSLADLTYLMEVARSPMATPVAPIIAAGRVVVSPTDSDRLLAFDLNSGRLLWDVPRRRGARWLGDLGGGRLFSAGEDTCLIDLIDGSERGRFPASSPRPPAILPGLAMLSGQGHLRAVVPGQLRAEVPWQLPAPGPSAEQPAAAVIDLGQADDAALVMTPGWLIAVGASTCSAWTLGTAP
ncbi:hypothetical protein LBMAG53_01620 [Planctomycetota bacterium]|nr:hypothetical protein LBMAG53_01620 [Planctomycetota bacterium]